MDPDSSKFDVVEELQRVAIMLEEDIKNVENDPHLRGKPDLISGFKLGIHTAQVLIRRNVSMLQTLKSVEKMKDMKENWLTKT